MPYILLFFTTWTCLLAVLHQYTHGCINLLYLTFVTLVIGSYISFCNPGKFTVLVKKKEVDYTGIRKLLIVDLLAHALVFLFIYWRYRDYYFSGTGHVDCTLAVAVLFTVLYILLINAENVYRTSFTELFLCFVVATCLYFFI